jgi:hypothetical protein
MEQTTPSPPSGVYKKGRGRAYVDTFMFEEHREEIRKCGVVRNKFSESIDNEITITTTKKPLASQSDGGTSLKRTSSHQQVCLCLCVCVFGFVALLTCLHRTLHFHLFIFIVLFCHLIKYLFGGILLLADLFAASQSDGGTSLKRTSSHQVCLCLWF